MLEPGPVRASKIDKYVSASARSAAEGLLSAYERGAGAAKPIWRGYRLWFDLTSFQPRTTRPYLAPAKIAPVEFAVDAAKKRRDSELHSILAARNLLPEYASSANRTLIAAEGNALDLSGVFPLMFVRRHDPATNSDRPGSDPVLNSLSADVNQRTATYASAYKELLALTEVFRAYVAAVHITRRDASVCADLRSQPLLAGEKVAHQLPPYHPTELFITFAGYEFSAGKYRKLLSNRANSLNGGVAICARPYLEDSLQGNCSDPKVDKGLADAKDGVQLMKPVPNLDKLLKRAVAKGIYGTKERSVIKEPNKAGIKAIATQQFEWGKQILAHGLVPILEPEVDIKAPNKAECEKILKEELLAGLETLKDGQQVIFKLTIPSEPNFYADLIKHPKVARVVALSGGYTRDDACEKLAKNHGMIASFSRALTEGLSGQQSDDDFNKTLKTAVDKIYAASIKANLTGSGAVALGEEDKDKGIDAYISIYFRDLPEKPAESEDIVAEVGSDLAKDLEKIEGLEIESITQAAGPGRSRFSGRARLEAQRSLTESGLVHHLEATARRPTIPVIIQSRTATWSGDVSGLEKGSRLGNILTGVATEEAIKALADDPDVISVEASCTGGIIECAKSMPWVGVPQVHAPPLAEKGKGAIVAMIDGGIDVLHEAFRSAEDKNKSRILVIWDQRHNDGPAPAAVAPGVYAQTYGTLHTQGDINDCIAANAPRKQLGRDFVGHGTHVLSIAAGSPIPAVSFPGGVAPEADLVVVIPKLGVSYGDPASLGYSTTHLDGLAFIRATADDAKAPVVTNVSLGMNAGAHDGSSLLELGFDAFSDGGRTPGYVIVKSAGNEFGHDGHSYVQAFQDGIIPIEWSTNANPRREDYLEFWFSSCDDLAFTIVPPHSAPSCSISRNAPSAKAEHPSGDFSVYAELSRFHVDNGDSRLIVSVRNNSGHALTTAGQWRLEIFGRSVFSTGGIHGWVERDNARAVHFQTGSANDMTLSIPATAKTVVSVGACEARDPLVLSNSSSRGPTRDERRKPELVAPGVYIIAAQAGTTNTGSLP